MLSNALSGYTKEMNRKKSKSSLSMPSLLLLLGRFDLSLPNQMDFGKFCTFGTGDGFRFPGICHRDRVEHSCSWKQQEVKHFELRKIL